MFDITPEIERLRQELELFCRNEIKKLQVELLSNDDQRTIPDSAFNRKPELDRLKQELELFCRNETEKLQRELLSNTGPIITTTKKEQQINTTPFQVTPSSNSKSPEFNQLLDICIDGEPRTMAFVAELLEEEN